MFRKVILMLLIQVGVLYANDTGIKGAGGTLKIKESENNISIQNELLNIDMFSDHYKISVQYDFLNDGVEKKILTGFPEYKFGTQSYTPIRNFNMKYLNGENIPTTFKEADERVSPAMKITGWYTKEITFKEKSTTTVKLEYESDYASSGFYKLVSYLFGTGKTWKNNINNLKIRINNNTDYWIEDVKIIGNTISYNYKYISDNIYEINIADYEPNIEDQLFITFSSNPKFTDPMWGFLLEESNIDSNWLRFLNTHQLRILRNSIFANRGYVFRTESLNQYFKSFDWYKPTRTFSEKIFTDIEKQNINIIRSVEDEIKNK